MSVVAVRRFGAEMALVVCALLFVGGAIGASPSRSTRYVDGSTARCSDSAGSGSLKKPFCTIGGAAAHLSPGVTVRVASGTYRERVVVQASGTARRPIVFTAAPRARVVISG